MSALKTLRRGNGFNTDHEVDNRRIAASIAAGNALQYGSRDYADAARTVATSGQTVNPSDVLDAITFGVTGSHSDANQNTMLAKMANDYGVSKGEVLAKIQSGEISTDNLKSQYDLTDGSDASTQRANTSLMVASGQRNGSIVEGSNGYYSAQTGQQVAGQWTPSASSANDPSSAYWMPNYATDANSIKELNLYNGPKYSENTQGGLLKWAVNTMETDSNYCGNSPFSLAAAKVIVGVYGAINGSSDPNALDSLDPVTSELAFGRRMVTAAVTPFAVAASEFAGPVAATSALITGTTSVISNGVGNLASSNDPSVGDFFTNADKAIIGGGATGWGLGAIADSGLATWKILGGSFAAGTGFDLGQSFFTNGEVTGADGVHAVLNGASTVGGYCNKEIIY